MQAAAAGAIASGRQLVGAALFCLALNHKQMSMYWAPAFFAHLLGWALQQRGHYAPGACNQQGAVEDHLLESESTCAVLLSASACTSAQM